MKKLMKQENKEWYQFRETINGTSFTNDYVELIFKEKQTKQQMKTCILDKCKNVERNAFPTTDSLKAAFHVCLKDF